MVVSIAFPPCTRAIHRTVERTTRGCGGRSGQHSCRRTRSKHRVDTLPPRRRRRRCSHRGESVYWPQAVSVWLEDVVKDRDVHVRNSLFLPNVPNRGRPFGSCHRNTVCAVFLGSGCGREAWGSFPTCLGLGGVESVSCFVCRQVNLRHI